MNDFQFFFIFCGDDRESGIGFDWVIGVYQFIVYLFGNGGFCQVWIDIQCDIYWINCVVKMVLVVIRKCNYRYFMFLFVVVFCMKEYI